MIVWRKCYVAALAVAIINSQQKVHFDIVMACLNTLKLEIKTLEKNIYEEQFTGDTGPAQMVIAFKNAEEKELRDMRELRKLNMEKKPGDDKFCVCRRKFQVQMYHCQLCKDWFVGTDANKFAEFCLLFLKILRIKKIL